MGEEPGYFRPLLTERVIAAGRWFLAVFLLLAVVLDPAETGPSPLLFQLVIAYVAYAAGVALLIWTRRIPTFILPAATQVVDLLLFAVFSHLTQGPTGPFLICFIFAVSCGAIRWHMRGAIITGAAGLGAYIGVTLSSAAFLGSSFELGRFIMRCTQLAVVTALLAYLGAYQHRLHSEIASLVGWRRRASSRPELTVLDVLTHAAGILRARGMVLAWHEQEEPALHVAINDGDRFELSELPPDAFGPLVAEPLRLSSFLCANVSAPSCDVILQGLDGFKAWRGAPLSATFRERYGIKTVLALRIVTTSVDGWLFALNPAELSVDDLLVGGVVGRLVGVALDQQTQMKQLRDAAVGQERLRLARELHDGVLQALSGVALQADRLRGLLTRDPDQAKSLLAEIEEVVLTEHRALRSVIEELKSSHPVEGTEVDCAGRLREVAIRLATQWDVRVHLDLAEDAPPLPRRLAHEICQMAQESVVNAIRHGAAKDVRLHWGAGVDRVNLTVAYAGRGFATFHGRHDLESLNRMKAGPRSLKQRVSHLRGALVINSDDDGATVDIAIPLTSAAAYDDPGRHR
jgi:signal transduction histidine kinase